ncbi:uncharacterized protein LOC107001900 isoform X2 [Solanum pennellii]|uniref:Uncharacterized protein LOC107001900 isoform X2 n=1 Tax=Solanum pennellii TaxID=28526 RepID=A0ABM1UX08_SOLPN|nr:uncharacterized protein LOC107001900 isoform X2 [Solanum pennellii]
MLCSSSQCKTIKVLQNSPCNSLCWMKSYFQLDKEVCELEVTTNWTCNYKMIKIYDNMLRSFKMKGTSIEPNLIEQLISSQNHFETQDHDVHSNELNISVDGNEESDLFLSR